MRAIDAVSAVVARDDGRVLLVRRAKAPLKGTLTLPGGRVEPSETPAAAATREVHEETGLEVEALARIAIIEVAGTDATPPYRIEVMKARLLSDPDAARPASDAAEVLWAKVSDLEALEVPSATRAAITAAGK